MARHAVSVGGVGGVNMAFGKSAAPRMGAHLRSGRSALLAGMVLHWHGMSWCGAVWYGMVSGIAEDGRGGRAWDWVDGGVA